MVNGVSKLKGKPVFHFTNDGPGAAKSGTGGVNVDGGQVHVTEAGMGLPWSNNHEYVFQKGVYDEDII